MAVEYTSGALDRYRGANTFSPAVPRIVPAQSAEQ